MAAGLLSRFKAGLRRTRERVSLQLKEVFTGRTRVDDELYEDLEAAMIEADLGVGPTQRVLEAVSERVRVERVSDAAQVQRMVGEEIRRLLVADGGADAAAAETEVAPAKPQVVLVVGVNGVGKTTTIGKLANLHRAAGRKVLIAAADTFRAAAVEQLACWAERADVRLVRAREGADPAAVVFDSLQAAVAGGHDVVLIDTAGRLHTKDNLMAELDKVRRVVGKRIDGAPHETLLVLDATTGQNALAQAREFGSRFGVTGLIVSKLDGTAKGGVVVAIAADHGIPVRYLGVGEGIDDLVEFDPAAFAEALFAA